MYDPEGKGVAGEFNPLSLVDGMEVIAGKTPIGYVANTAKMGAASTNPHVHVGILPWGIFDKTRYFYAPGAKTKRSQFPGAGGTTADQNELGWGSYRMIIPPREFRQWLELPE
jgi:hypothetical protein